ncbi:MAG: hypothetical protein QG628_134 [Patescibacteria group bacterium]|nr:hypothetical protein [Patescibacteria group bacterium]
MIELTKTGTYKLIETKHHTKVLYLDNAIYAWLEPANIGEILVTSHAIHKTDCILSIGTYNIYEVDDEQNITDLQHLELEVGKNNWQGYLLLTGLPDDSKKRGRIVPTIEVISGKFNRSYMKSGSKGGKI